MRYGTEPFISPVSGLTNIYQFGQFLLGISVFNTQVIENKISLLYYRIPIDNSINLVYTNGAIKLYTFTNSLNIVANLTTLFYIVISLKIGYLYFITKFIENQVFIH